MKASGPRCYIETIETLVGPTDKKELPNEENLSRKHVRLLQHESRRY